VILDEGFITNALGGFSFDEKIGMVSGKLLRSDRRTIDSAGLFLSRWRAAKERGYGFKDRGQFEKEEYVFGVNGAVAFYRKKMLDEIRVGEEYFDSDFRMFYEDLDIAWRAQNAGWRGYYVPFAIAYHIRGGTARAQGGIDKTYARRYLRDDLHVDLIKNRYFTIIKNESFSGFIAHLPCIILYDLIIWGYLIFFRPRLIKPFLVAFKKLAKAILIKRESQRLKALKRQP
jgi:GT2 family glycosyltransferase